jgi:hypothetical protein
MEPAKDLDVCEVCDLVIKKEELSHNSCVDCGVDILCDCNRTKPKCNFCNCSMILCSNHISKYFKRCVYCNTIICRTCSASGDLFENECPDPICKRIGSLNWTEQNLGHRLPETYHTLCPNCVNRTSMRCHECNIIVPHKYVARCCSKRACYNCLKSVKICEFCSARYCKNTQQQHVIDNCYKCQSEFIPNSLVPICLGMRRCTSCIMLKVSHYKNCIFCRRTMTRELAVRRCTNCSYEHRVRVCTEHVTAFNNIPTTKWNSCKICNDWICHKCRSETPRKPLICTVCINRVDTLYEELEETGLINDLVLIVIRYAVGDRLGKLWRA